MMSTRETYSISANFQKLISGKKLSHSYIFFGQPDLDTAQSLANFLENKKWELPKIPLIDLLLLTPDDKGKISIETIKETNKLLWQAPLKSSHKTLLINQAETLTPQAKNAILKIAEDPPSRSLIILLTKDPDLLLAPLVSRFQKIFCAAKNYAPKASNSRLTPAQKFFKGDAIKRSAIIKEVASDNAKLKEFVYSVMQELDKDPIKNFTALKELSYRWSLISRYNTNKKLQLEAWLQSFSGS